MKYHGLGPLGAKAIAWPLQVSKEHPHCTTPPARVKVQKNDF